MTISLKVENKFVKLGQEKISKSVKAFYREVAAILPNVIADNIRKGISPVEGVGRFKQYSPSYVKTIEFNRKSEKKNIKTNEKRLSKGKDAIDSRNGKTAQMFRGKLKSPVNLFLSGKMMASLKSILGQNEVTIVFESPIAKYHNGEGRVDRPLLPTDGRNFSSLIMKKLKDILKNSFKT